MRPGRLLIVIGGALAVIAVERIVNAWLLGFVADESRSVRLAIAFISGGLAPLFLGIGLLRAAAAPDDDAGSETPC